MSIEITTLENGVRVVTHEMPHLETASLGVWVNAGSRNERHDQHGISHMLEHMAFKGTRRRSARDIALEIEAVGGDINAATSFENTSYTVRMMKDDVPLGMDILGDILSNPAFDETELARERQVIIQEIGAARDIPDDLVFDLFQETAFPNQALGRPILGTPDTVSGFGADHLNDYMGAHYRGPALVVSAAGALTHNQLVDLASNTFGGFENAADVNIETDSALYAGGENRLERDLEQTHLLLGFEGVDYINDDFYAAQVFSGVLGGGLSSRLFQEVRENRGLCYSVYSFHWAFRDTGLFGLYAATSGDLVAELTPVMCNEVLSALETITEEEVARVRAQVKTGIAMSLESSAARASQMARQLLLFGRIIPVEEIISKIDGLDEKAVMETGQRLVGQGNLTVAAIGDLSGLATCGKITDQLKS